jgi:hypothetical protein
MVWPRSQPRDPRAFETCRGRCGRAPARHDRSRYACRHRASHQEPVGCRPVSHRFARLAENAITTFENVTPIGSAVFKAMVPITPLLKTNFERITAAQLRTIAEQAPGLAVTRNRIRKTINEQLKAKRPHRGGPQPIETVVDRWELGAFAATTEAARVSVPSADP